MPGNNFDANQNEQDEQANPRLRSACRVASHTPGPQDKERQEKDVAADGNPMTEPGSSNQGNAP